MDEVARLFRVDHGFRPERKAARLLRSMERKHGRPLLVELPHGLFTTRTLLAQVIPGLASPSLGLIGEALTIVRKGMQSLHNRVDAVEELLQA